MIFIEDSVHDSQVIPALNLNRKESTFKAKKESQFKVKSPINGNLE